MLRNIVLIGILLVSCANQDPLSIDNLESPRGLFPMDNGNILIAEVAAGRILEWDPDSGSLEVLFYNLPYTKEGPELVPAGVSAVVHFDQLTYFIVGEHRGKGFREVYKAQSNSTPIPITGQEIQGLDPPNRITNPYDIVNAPIGGFYVSDSGRDAIWHISENGAIKDFMIFDSYPFTMEDGTVVQLDVVPTGIVMGLDDALYVASLTGFPFPAGAGHVYKLQDLNEDGDALDPGESTIYASGFTAATDLAFCEDGTLLVSEFSSDMKSLSEKGYEGANEFKGRLVQWDEGAIAVLKQELISPTAIAVDGEGKIFISEEFAGRVTEFRK